jgi:hypothetical protein
MVAPVGYGVARSRLAPVCLFFPIRRSYLKEERVFERLSKELNLNFTRGTRSSVNPQSECLPAHNYARDLSRSALLLDSSPACPN